MKKQRSTSAGTLLEVILAIGILVIVFTAIVGMGLGGLTSVTRGKESLEATALVQEGLEATRSMRDFDWSTLTAGTHGLSDASGYWVFAGASDTVGRYTRQITVADVDTVTKDVTVRITWQSLPGGTRTLETTNRFTQWQKTLWTQTLAADFSAGTRNSTRVTNVAGGEIELDNRADFVGAGVYATHDFSGGGDITDIAGDGNTLYIVTTNDGTGKEFASVDISNVSNGIITDGNSLELGTQANKLVVSGGYAYIATNSNSEEIMIVRLSDFTKVNTINIAGSEDAYGLFLSGTTLYVTTKKSSGKEFHAYNIPNPEGTIGAPLGSTELNADVEDVAISGGYAYVATNDNAKEFSVIRLSDFTSVNSVNLSGDADATSVRISGTTAYIGRKSGNPEAEFYSLNIASPEGTITETGSVDLGTDQTVVDFVILGNTAYVATQRDGGQQSKKLAIINTAPMTTTGWIDFDDSENAHSQAVWMQGAYIYIGSSHNTETLQVIQGNAGAGIAAVGTFTSSPFDTGSAGTTYESLSWTQSGSGTIRFQLKTAATQGDLATAAWVGPDRTNATFYTTSGTAITTAPGAGERWIQYQAELSGDGSATPILNDVSIAYAN